GGAGHRQADAQQCAPGQPWWRHADPEQRAAVVRLAPERGEAAMRADGMTSPVAGRQSPVRGVCGRAAGRRLLVAALLVLVAATPGRAMDDAAPGDRHASPTEGERSEALEAAPAPVPPPALPSLGGEPL